MWDKFSKSGNSHFIYESPPNPLWVALKYGNINIKFHITFWFYQISNKINHILISFCTYEICYIIHNIRNLLFIVTKISRNITKPTIHNMLFIVMKTLYYEIYYSKLRNLLFIIMNGTCYFITTKFVIHNYKKTKKNTLCACVWKWSVYACMYVCENCFSN